MFGKKETTQPDISVVNDQILRTDALYKRVNTLEKSLYEMSTILSEVRAAVASLNARVTTSTRTQHKLSPIDEIKAELAKVKGIDVTELMKDDAPQDK